MELNEYQEKAMTTCMESCENFSYMFINLVGEVGEFASKIAKGIRKKKLTIGGKDEMACNDIKYLDEYSETSGEYIETNIDLQKEAGDILWQLSGLCSVMGWPLEDIAKMNLHKLAMRKAVGTIDGSGDGIMRGK